MASHRQLSKTKKKLLWRMVLAAMLVLEIVLLVVGLVSLVKDHTGIDFYQVVVFIAIAIWIYIAYLKQRAIDVSNLVVDEKIKTHSLLENMKDGAILVDQNNTVLHVNSRASKLTGLHSAELLGKNLATEVDSGAREMLESGQDGRVEANVAGSMNRVNFNIFALRETMSEDECKLIYVDEIVSGQQDVEKSGLVQDGISSEQYAGVLLDMFVGITSALESVSAPESKVALARLSLRALTHAAAGMLSKLQTVVAKPEGQACPGKVFNQAALEIKGAAAALGITLDVDGVDEKVEIKTDENALLWMFRQLLGEALLNTVPESGPVLVRFGVMGSNLEITVFDRGPAVDSEVTGFLFKSAYNGVRNNNGTVVRAVGSGLCLVRMLAESLGGTVLAESPPQAGLRVTMLLGLS